MDVVIRQFKRRHILAAFSALLIAALACGGSEGIQTEAPAPTATGRTGTLGGGATEEPLAVLEPDADAGEGSEPSIAAGLSRRDLISATVQILGVTVQGEDVAVLYTGSGTVLDESGVILTNAHVADPGTVGYPQQFWPDALIVAVNEAEDRPPVPTFVAEVAAIEPKLDLAAIRIVSTLDGSPVNGAIGLPVVPTADSDQLHVGDTLEIFGFPGIGGETITFTTGNVSGFTEEEGVGDRAWIKTDATIAGGNSGGLAADSIGQIVGVPTRLGSGQDDISFTDCRVVQDTNFDGVVDENDTCIPTGGFINAVRPINLARPLVQAAIAGVAYEPIYGSPFAETSPAPAGVKLTDILWSSGVDANGEPVDNVENGFPAGMSEIYAFFGYEGMQDGLPVTRVWYLDGQLALQATDPWDAGSDGIFNVSIYSDEGSLPDGEYRVEIYIGEELGTSGVTTIGGGVAQSPQQPANGVAVFGTVVDATTGRPIPGAGVVWLNPGVAVADWTGAADQVWDSAQTDARGQFVMNFLLNYGDTYSLIVAADGYQPFTRDHLEVTPDTPAELELTIELQP